MSIFDYFFGRSQNSSNKRRSADRTRNLRMEALEERALLSVTSLSADEYSALCAQYSEFNLPEDMAELNVITLDLAEGDGLAELKSAIETAGSTDVSDLIVVRTSDDANTIQYTDDNNDLTINIDTGSITIVGYGSKPFTLDANQYNRVITIEGESTVANLGGLTIINGMWLGSGSSGGTGIFNDSGTLTVTNCSILGNKDCGIYNSDGTLKVINSAISENNGGGIECYGQDSTLTVTNSTISENEQGGIFIDSHSQNSKLTITNCTILDNGFCGIFSSGQNSTLTVTDSTILENESGIHNSNGTLTVTDSTISENEGGIYSYNGTLTITNCTISKNEDSGIEGSGALTITNCTISENEANGGIRGSGALTVNDCTISKNKGRGIDCSGQDSTLTVTNCTISENEGSGIGGSGTLTVTNCTISGNMADSGGGIFNSGALTVTNCTISGNTAELGGGIFNPSETGAVTINNSIVLDAIEGISGTISGSNNLSTKTYWSSGSNNITYDPTKPLFAEGDFSLDAGSQAIDKGSNVKAYEAGLTVSSTDLSGNPRYNNSFVDIGAYEFQSDDTYSTVVTTLNDSFDFYDDEWSLREAIYYAADYPTITFAEGLEGQIDLALGELAIENALIIDGDGRITINADRKSRVFNVTSTAGTEETPVVLNGLTIANGYDSYGGGIANYGILTVTDSKISGNEVQLSGGGIGNYGTIQIINSVLTDNSAANSGGGIHNDTGSAAITNCTIWGNVSSGELTGSNGGGISSYLSNVIVNNSIIAGNTGKDSGNDIFIVDTDPTANNHSIISGSNNLSSYAGFSSDSGNITYDPTIPLFNNAAAGDYRILPKSQAIDNGSNTFATNAGLTETSTDIYGNSRFDGVIDIGAYEFQSDVTYSTVVTTLDDSFDFYDDEWSLREAIYYAPGYVEITFRDDLNGTITLSDRQQLEIIQPMSIDGDDRITIDGDNASRVFYVSAGTEETPVALIGLTIQNGSADQGGGIYISSGVLTVTDSTISGNTADFGGGIFNDSGTLTVTNSAISGNTASVNGGGIVNYAGMLTVTNSTISENTATSGGGIGNYSGTLMVTDSTISENIASVNGGGIDNGAGSSFTVTNCTIFENHANGDDDRESLGGGIFNLGTLTVTNCTISENHANGDDDRVSLGGGIYSLGTLSVSNSTITQNSALRCGGGIYSNESSLTVVNSTISENNSNWGAGIYAGASTLTITNSLISDNTANSQGGGIRTFECTTTITNSTIAGNAAQYGAGITNSGTITAYNNIIAANTASVDGNDVYGDGSVSGSNNLSSFTGWTSGSNNLEYNAKLPLFVDAANGDYHLTLSSQAINKGSNQYAADAGLEETSTDFSGASRYVDEIIDIGAYEYQNDYSYSSVVNTLDDVFDLDDEVWSLREAIYYAPGYVEISFSEDLNGTITLSDGQLEIIQAMSIDGDNRITIDGDNASRVFYVSAGTEEQPVVLNGLTIQNGYADYAGGGIYNTGALTITNSTITGNAAEHDGGGIDNHNSGVLLTIENSVISNNTAMYGGGIHNFYGALTIADSTISDNEASCYGGGIHNYGEFTLTSSEISENSAKNGGGIYNEPSGDLTVNSSTISGNTATVNGGGIYSNTGNCSIESSTISGNESAYGGGVYSLENVLTVTDSVFSENKASSDGGGIRTIYCNATITNSEISDNEANSGAGIHNYSGTTLTVTGSTFSGNKATEKGGGISNQGTLTLTGSTISGNTTNANNSMGCGLYNSEGTATITNSKISGNSSLGSYSNGGGLYSTDGVLTVMNCSISNNVSDWGGGVYIRMSSLTIANSLIVDNTAYSYGGGIRTATVSNTIKITNCTIAGNLANYGGGICDSSQNTNYSINNTILAANTAKSSGNDTYFHNVSNSFSGSNNLSTYTGWSSGSGNISYDSTKPLFNNNASAGDYRILPKSQAVNKGSNTYAANAGLTGTSTDIYGNSRFVGVIDIGSAEYQNDVAYSSVVTTLNDSFDLYDDEWSLREAIYCATNYPTITFAEELEGQIDLTKGQLEILDALTIDGDGRITIDGGEKSSVFNVSAGTTENPVVLNGLTIQNGYAVNGGGIHNKNGVLTVTNSTITNNSASIGGGIRNDIGTLTVSNCVITENSATSGGGGINSNAGTLTVTNSTIKENSATENGGGIDLTYTTAEVSNTEISGNTASAGGGIYSHYDSVLVVSGSQFTNNEASYGGGGILNSSNSTLTVTGCTFSENSAPGVAGGGAIRNDNGTVTVKNSLISNNSGRDAGGIRGNVGSITITDTIISGNTASSSGGGINLTYTDAVIINSAIINNSAKWSGAISNCYNSTITVRNSTIAGNSASVSGGGITNSGTITSYNTIIAGNTAKENLNDISLTSEEGAVNARIVKGSNNLSSYASWTSGSNNLVYDSAKPLFVDAANGDYRLTTGSQAINKGSNSQAVNASGQAIARDLDNLARIMYNSVDIGAYEYRDLPVPALSAEMTGIDSIKVTVGEVTNASGYTLEYSTDEDFADAVSLDVSAGEMAITGLSVNTTYYFRAMALGEGDYRDSVFCDSTSATTDRIQLIVPTLSALTTGTDSIVVTVGAVTNASGYTLEYSSSEDFADAVSLNVSAGETTIDGLNANRTYYFRTMALGVGDYRDSEFSVSASSTTDRITLTAPTLSSSVKKATATYTWDADPNASGYQFEYKAVDAEEWIVENVDETSFSFEGEQDVTYTARVLALGVGDYTDSAYSAELDAYINGAQVTINGKKVTVNWVDDSPAADSIRYRVAGTTKWTVKKLKAGVTTFTFSGKVGTNYEIEVLLDQQEVKTFKTEAIVLDQPKLKADKAFLKDDAFQVSVTNYAAKNLADNVKQAILTVNGVQTTLDIENQEGSAELTNGGFVAFNNGLFTFSEMNSNTSYKVQISFSDGLSVSTVSSTLSVKTLKAPYLAPVIVSANAVSDTAITVTWETAFGKNSTTPAQKYTVQYSTNGNKWTNATTSAKGNEYTVQKLKGGVEYQVRVLATKDAAFEASEPSEVLTAETLTLPKTVLDKTSVKDDTFKLDVTNYATSNLVNAPTLNVKSDKFGETAIAIQNGSGSATFENGMVATFENDALTFTNAPSNTQQKIQVNFSNGVCTTAWTAALTVKTTKAAYNKPVLTNATADSSTSIVVEWEPAYGKNTTVEAPSYTVQYTTDGTRWINANAKVVGTNFTISKLKPNTTYRVAVIANKDAQFNASEPSESLEVRTL